MICAMQLEQCCVCRSPIEKREEIEPSEARTKKEFKSANNTNGAADSVEESNEFTQSSENRYVDHCAMARLHRGSSWAANESLSLAPTKVCTA